MPLQCNIDSRGRAARLIYGILMIGLGAFLVFAWARGSGSILAWVVSLACVFGGGFAIFEARAGWCVLRAMGVKTPM